MTCLKLKTFASLLMLLCFCAMSTEAASRPKLVIKKSDTRETSGTSGGQGSSATSTGGAGVREGAGEGGAGAGNFKPFNTAVTGGGGGGGAAGSGKSAPAPKSQAVSGAVPGTCMGRRVVFRDWTCSAKGDGSYFSGQAPGRLGFQVEVGVMHIVRIKTPPVGSPVRGKRLTGTTDGGAWLSVFMSKNPCDPANAIHLGGGSTGDSVNYIVASQAQYAQMLAQEPSVKWMARADPDTFYYFHAIPANPQDIVGPPHSPSSPNMNPPDTCDGLKDYQDSFPHDPASGPTGHDTPYCYYLSLEGGIDYLNPGPMCHDYRGEPVPAPGTGPGTTPRPPAVTPPPAVPQCNVLNCAGGSYRLEYYGFSPQPPHCTTQRVGQACGAGAGGCLLAVPVTCGD
ncbi:MAG: hypothetical protein NDI60_05140 [Elusimicrobiales bacterium]|nr:hypothetical protein [Elusimicrobiales bacterium]